MTQLINRDAYLNQLISFKDKQLIKVISGIRRCGKSTLFTLFQQYLYTQGVEKNQIIHINFEDLENESFLSYQALYQHIKGLLLPDKRNYIFLDEIQHVAQFEKVVDSLFIKENVDVYITGSNAYFMSGELATLLSGRYIEIKMLPLSFKEFCMASDTTQPLQTLYNQYITNGAFPYSLKLDSLDDIQSYLQGVYNTIILHDIVARHNIADVKMLDSVVKYLFMHVGSRITVSKIVNTMVSMGRKINPKTVEKYIKGLTDSLIIYESSRYNIKGKTILSLQEKYYVADLGLRYNLLGGKDLNVGHILENVIFLELLRRGYRVNVGQIEKNEVDFVARKNNTLLYVQVAASVRDNATLTRELSSLQQIKDNYPKILLTLDNDPAADYEGITRQNALDWLLE